MLWTRFGLRDKFGDAPRAARGCKTRSVEKPRRSLSVQALLNTLTRLLFAPSVAGITLTRSQGGVCVGDRCDYNICADARATALLFARPGARSCAFPPRERRAPGGRLPPTKDAGFGHLIELSDAGA